MDKKNNKQFREIVDMAGRKALIPTQINSIYAPSPYGFTILYSLAPDMLPGVIFPLKNRDIKYLNPCIHNLPVIGRLKDTEALAQANPDVVIVWADAENPFHKKSEDVLNELNLPFLYVTVGELANLEDYPAAYRFIGKLINREGRAQKLAEYCEKTLAKVLDIIKTIPESKKLKVYYAECESWLNTEFDDSLHVHLLKIIGDLNIRKGKTTCHAGMEPISIEELTELNPDVIIAQDEKFYSKVFDAPEWQKINAVKNKRVHMIPQAPFNWFDRPPSFMRFLGLQWLMTKVYPEYMDIDLLQETCDFYKLFLNIEISKTEAKEIIDVI